MAKNEWDKRSAAERILFWLIVIVGGLGLLAVVARVVLNLAGYRI